MPERGFAMDEPTTTCAECRELVPVRTTTTRAGNTLCFRCDERFKAEQADRAATKKLTVLLAWAVVAVVLFLSPTRRLTRYAIATALEWTVANRIESRTWTP
jgi:hypothetical protein